MPPSATGARRPSSGLRVDELCAPWLLDGPMNRAAFDTYIETQLAPVLQPGDVVIADNLAAHKSAKAQALLKSQGNWMLFLPPYSPDPNPPSRDIAAQCTVGQRSRWHFPNSRLTCEKRRQEPSMPLPLPSAIFANCSPPKSAKTTSRLQNMFQNRINVRRSRPLRSESTLPQVCPKPSGAITSQPPIIRDTAVQML